MPHYLIESPHTKEECLKALDEVVEKEPELLDKYEFACMSGEHTGWVTVEANDTEEAKRKVPEFIRGKARVIPVEKLTREQIESFHKM
ncbi:MAG: hypothetical protein HYX78_04320 [Armatimonadetes bacterium]|nr:hypothetical protein [Armatimonadota bacterium]